MRRHAVLVLAVVGILVAGCSSSGDDEATPEATTTTAADTTTTGASSCEALSADLAARVSASLEGEPAPQLSHASTAMFTVGGDPGRIVAATLDGPGVDDEVAVWAIGPSGTIYSANAIAEAFSTFESIDLDSGWDDPIDEVTGCL